MKVQSDYIHPEDDSSHLRLESLLVIAGIALDQATQISAQCHKSIIKTHSRGSLLSDSQVFEACRRVLAEKKIKGIFSTERLHMCKRLLSHSIPLVICISGSSGTGKSTIASRLRAKLGVSRVISTDTIREEMRSSGRFSQSSFPGLYVSTYESYQLIPDANLSLQEKVESSYLQQCDLVMTEVCSSIQSLILEQKPFILEGVHLSLKHVEEIQRLCSSHIFLSVLLHVEDNDSYINRFSSRVPQGSLDPKTNKYVRHFSAITGIQDYLLRTFSESKNLSPLIFVNHELESTLKQLHSTALDYVQDFIETLGQKL